MEAIDTRQAGPLTVELHHDPFPDDDPRDWTNVSTWVELRAEQVETLWYDPEKVADYLREHYGARHIVAVSLGSRGAQPYVSSYEVSEMATARFVDYWQIDTPQGRKDVYGGSAYVPEEAVREMMDEERRAFEAWHCGEVYGWTVTDAQGDELESCWGYVGEPGYAMSVGIEEAEAILGQAGERYDSIPADNRALVDGRYAMLERTTRMGVAHGRLGAGLLTVHDSLEDAANFHEDGWAIERVVDLYTGDEYEAVPTVKFVAREREEVAS